MTTDLRKWVAFGTGVGIEIRDHELQVTVVRVRPSQTGVVGSATVLDYRNRPAAEWGAELSTFLKKLGAAHFAATVLLPRRDVIVRQISLPGVSDRDLASAIQLQVDSLHPFADEEVAYTHARLGKTSSVLVGIARRDAIVSYSALFAEAGIKVASFTFSAAALYSAMRVITPAPAAGFIALHEHGGECEIYGESGARPLFSASLVLPPERAHALAAAELRLDPATELTPLARLLPVPAVFPPSYDPSSAEFETNAFAYATAVAGACPWLSIEGNLLPPDQRRTSSRVRLIPTIALASVLLVLTGALAAHSSYADARYLGLLQHEIRRLDPQARRLETIDRDITRLRARSRAVDDFRMRLKLDMDTLGEITKLIPPPGWVTSLELDRDLIQLSGEAEQVAELLKAFDGSPYFEKSQFTMPITRGNTGDLFRLRAARQNPPAPVAPVNPVVTPPNPGAAK